PQKTTSAWDLVSYMTLHPDYEQGGIYDKPTSKSEDEIANNDPFLFACLLSPPKLHGKGIDDGSLVSLLRSREVHKELEAIDGRRCCVVDHKRVNGSLFVRAW